MSTDPIIIEPPAPPSEIGRLLAECGLPVSDISPLHPVRFFGIRRGDELAAVAGVELYGPDGLLRSLAVSPRYRGIGLARQLVAHAGQVVASEGVHSLYLLTTTASEYFGRLGFELVSRADAPSAIQATTQFSGLCPSSAVFMRKSVDKKGVSIRLGNTSKQVDGICHSHLNSSLDEHDMTILTPRELELVALGAAMGSNCAPCIDYHIREVKKIGLGEREILEAIRFADKVRQVPANKVLQTALRLLPSAADGFQSAPVAESCGCASSVAVTEKGCGCG